MIYSVNEWSQLRSVVVGDATHANWPQYDPVFALESEKTTWKESPVPQGPVPQWIIDEANQDLQQLTQALTSLGVQVFRPDRLNFQSHDGMYNYCPRDRLLVYGDTVIDTAMMYPCRDMEIQCYHEILKSAKRLITMPRNMGLVLDAANVLRFNDRMLFLQSASGNQAAYQWLCEQFPTVDIELCNFYSGVHIDSTIVPLRDNLVLLNGSRVNKDTVPRMFDNWQKIWVNDVCAQNFYQYPYASKWIGLNLLVVNPSTLICSQDQPELIRTLEHYDFTVHALNLRHSRTLGGGFHCVTLDLCRD